MKIPVTNYQLTLHRPGEIAHHSPEKIAKPSLTSSDLRPINLGPTNERETAFRIRSHFISQARKLAAYIVMNPDEAKNPRPILQPVNVPEDQTLSKKSVQLAAEETLKNVRLALYNRTYGSFKSTNKFNLDKKDSEVERFKNGKFYLFSDVDGIKNPFHQAAVKSRGIWESTLINCDGLASAAMDYVHHEYPNIPVAVVLLPAHTLMTLGEIKPEIATLPLGAWPDDIHICDPWANITCPAPEYPQKFLQKMEKWKSGNKMIQTGSEWINPTSEKWRSCVGEPPKIWVRQKYEKGLYLDLKLLPPSADREA